MKILIRWLVIGAASYALYVNSSFAAELAPMVALETNLGAIVIQLDAVHAPISTANFLTYVKNGSYDGGRFHRTVTTKPDNQPGQDVKIDVIQAGPNSTSQDLAPITLESTNITGLHNKNGTISMARTNDPDSATSDFFICIGDQPDLDFGGKRAADGKGFAAFGQVLIGMEAVRKIHHSPSDAQQDLTPPISITQAIILQ